MAINVSTTVTQSLTVNGTATGYVTVSNASAFYLGAICYIANGTSNQQVIIVEQTLSTNVLGLRVYPSSTNYGRSTMVAYTTASSSTLTMPPQTIFGVDEVGSSTAVGTFAQITDTGTLSLDGVLYDPSGALSLEGGATDGASAVGLKIGNASTLANATAKLAAFYSDAFSTEKLAVLASGALLSPSTFTIKSGATASTDGVVFSTTTAVTGNLLVVQNNGSQRFAVYYDGRIFPENSIFAPGGITTVRVQGAASTVSTVALWGNITDSANSAVVLDNETALTNASAKIASFRNATVEKHAVMGDGRLAWPTGGAADVVGTVTLIGGTKTVSTTAVKATSIIIVSCNTPGGTQGMLSAPAASITAGTSFVINSSQGADTSTVNYWVFN